LNNIGKNENPKNIPLVCMLEEIKALKIADSIEEYILLLLARIRDSLKLK
jgi:hypothetical protein